MSQSDTDDAPEAILGHAKTMTAEDHDAAPFYHPAQRARQHTGGTQPLADALAATIVSAELSDEHIEFISSRDFFFLATVDPDGHPTVSYKGGAPGFVHVVDRSTLVFPNYDGNGMFFSMGNIDATAKIGMLFIDMETPHRLRVQATATVSEDDPERHRFPGADLICRATITSSFVNCGRYIHKHRRIEDSKFVPDVDGEQPYPAWKRIDLMQPVLPERDQGRADAAGGTITVGEYAERLRRGEP